LRAISGGRGRLRERPAVVNPARRDRRESVVPISRSSRRSASSHIRSAPTRMPTPICRVLIVARFSAASVSASTARSKTTRSVFGSARRTPSAISSPSGVLKNPPSCSVRKPTARAPQTSQIAMAQTTAFALVCPVLRSNYVRQLGDMKGSVPIEKLSAGALIDYARGCGLALARAHARSGDPVAIAGYLGGGAEISDPGAQRHPPWREIVDGSLRGVRRRPASVTAIKRAASSRTPSGVG
jgi:hypothetical protein